MSYVYIILHKYVCICRIPYISALFATQKFPHLYCWNDQRLQRPRRPDNGEAQPCTRRARGLAPADR